MDFKEITLKQEDKAKAKFLEHGKGVIMTPHVAYVNADEASAKWHDLINSAKHAEQSIINKMKNIAVSIKQSCDDPYLGDTSIVFTHTTELDEDILFTHEDCYLFLRSVIRHRRNTEEYKTKKARITELQAVVETTKTAKEKRTDARKELAALQDSL